MGRIDRIREFPDEFPGWISSSFRTISHNLAGSSTAKNPPKEESNRRVAQGIREQPCGVFPGWPNQRRLRLNSFFERSLLWTSRWKQPRTDALLRLPTPLTINSNKTLHKLGENSRNFQTFSYFQACQQLQLASKHFPLMKNRFSRVLFRQHGVET
jgi:hypothetical protein